MRIILDNANCGSFPASLVGSREIVSLVVRP